MRGGLQWRRGVVLMFESNMSHFYGLQSINLMIVFDEDWHVGLIGIFPSVVAFRIALSFDQILQGLVLSPSSVGTDLFHFFIFIFSIN
jgi:hypothetical protein